MARAPRQLPRVHLAVPDTLDLDALRAAHPPTFPFKADVCAVILDEMYHLRYWKRSKRHKKQLRLYYVRLKAKYVERNIHRHAAKYLHWLERAGVIVTDHSYCVDHYAKSYALAGAYRHRRVRKYRCTDWTTARKLLNRRRRQANPPEPEHPSPPHLKIPREIMIRAAERLGIRPRASDFISTREALSELRWYADNPSPELSDPVTFCCAGMTFFEFRFSDPKRREPQRCPNNVPHFCTLARAAETEERLRADLESVTLRDGWREYIQHQYESGCWTADAANHADMACQAIEDGRFRFGRDATAGRLHTNVTGLNKGIRPFLQLRGDGDLVMLDIRASQPYLLTGLMRWLARIDADQPELAAAADQWASFVTGKADPYAVIASLTTHRPAATITKDERDAAKDETMRLLFSHPEQRQAFKGNFERAFPETAQFIRRLKRFRYQECAVMLQWYEAEVMIGAVAERLGLAGVPVLTVHDCAIVRRADADFTQEVIAREFTRVVSTPPVLTREWLNPP